MLTGCLPFISFLQLIESSDGDNHCAPSAKDGFISTTVEESLPAPRWGMPG